MNIHDYLIETGNYPNLVGFNYLIRAVEIVQERGKIKLCQDLYPMIAKEYKTSATKVERAIRHILTNKIKIKDYQRIGINKRPTAGEFIYYFATMKGEKYGK